MSKSRRKSSIGCVRVLFELKLVYEIKLDLRRGCGNIERNGRSQSVLPWWERALPKLGTIVSPMDTRYRIKVTRDKSVTMMLYETFY